MGTAKTLCVLTGDSMQDYLQDALDHYNAFVKEKGGAKLKAALEAITDLRESLNGGIWIGELGPRFLTRV